MRIAVFSDIHGNLEALQTALNYLTDQKIKQCLCLGDIVGYGANPNECVKVIKEMNCLSVAGNHDFGVLEKTDISNFHHAAQDAIFWIRKQIATEVKEYLENLPVSANFQDLFLVHATCQNPLRWHYLLNAQQAQDDFAYLKEKIGFIGHSHVPIVFEYCDTTKKTEVINAEKVEIKPGDYRYLINTGSIGQPRDGNPQTCFVIVDTANGLVEYIRLDYDIKLTQKKIRAAGLPEILASRLEIGK